MATNFGFMPVLTGKRYFISYKSEDSERIGAITRRLNEMGVPMWYDYGIEKGENWSNEINRNIEECEAFILFATRSLFAAEDTWVRKEFRLAGMSKKKKYVVWLDDLNPYENPNDVHSQLKAWYVDVDDLQGIRMAGKTVDHIAWSMVTEFHLIQGQTPQPPSPTYQPPAPKAEPKPVAVFQPESPPKPVTVQKPESSPKPAANSVSSSQQTVTRPSTAPIFRDSTPKQEQTKPAAKTSVKRTPLIVTVALVLVVAVVSGIWAISNSTNDSTESVKSLSELGSVSVGEHFTFGNYPQGADGEVEPIEWRVLDVQDGKALVISEKLLDCVPYNKTYKNVTWEICTLRKWMNNDFISEAFSSSQQAQIVKVTNQNPNNPFKGTKGGSATQDRIFALSIEEAEKYFGSNDDRMAAPTEYAIKNGAWKSDGYSLSTGEKTGWWWLRSPGDDSSGAADVDASGDVDQYGLGVDFSYGAVRPAFWLNL